MTFSYRKIIINSAILEWDPCTLMKNFSKSLDIFAIGIKPCPRTSPPQYCQQLQLAESHQWKNLLLQISCRNTS